MFVPSTDELMIGNSLIASSWKGIAYVKAYAVPRNPRSMLQQQNRQRFGGAKGAWRRLSADERKAYGRAAKRMSGWNLFVREYMARTCETTDATSARVGELTELAPRSECPQDEVAVPELVP